MERKGTTDTAVTSEIVSSVKEELPVEMDFVLPDDCPDIVKILHTALGLGSVITNADTDGLAIEGTVTAQVWYIADTGLLHMVEGNSGFSKKFRFELPEGCLHEPNGVLLQAFPEYVNARAVNQRRLEIKGAMALLPQVSALRKQDYLTDCAAPGVEVLRVQHEPVCPVGHSTVVFTVDEERVLDAAPAVGTLLRCEARARLTDRKSVEGRLVTKGELAVRCMYLPQGSDEGRDTPASVDFTLPISQLAQLPDFDESDDACALYRVCRVRAEPRADETGERRILHLRVEIALDVTVHRPVVLSGIADAYGLLHPVELQQGTLQIPVLLGTIEQTLPIRKSCEHPVSGVTEVLDVWATVTPGSCRRLENEMLIPLKLSLCAFVRDTNGRPAFFDRTEELSCTIPVEAENPDCRDLVASVAEVSVALTGSTLDFTGSVLLTGCLYDRRRFDLLCGIETDENARTTAPDTPLAMYFADEGESVWEIAKRFGAPTARICEENGLCGAVVAERCLLMIDRA